MSRAFHPRSPDPAFHLRPAATAELDAIAALWHASASLPGVGPVDMPGPVELRRRLDDGLADGWLLTVAAAGQGILGFVAIRPTGAELAQLFVGPHSSGLGVGQALLWHAKSAMPAGFTLLTRSGNGKARRFYENAGLRLLRHDVHPRTGDPVVHYGWNIA